jgi:hypothetical protein
VRGEAAGVRWPLRLVQDAGRQQGSLLLTGQPEQ